MKGRISKGGKMTITLDLNSEKLEAPKTETGNPRHYLPCHRCGEVHTVPWHVVSFLCDGCTASIEEQAKSG